MQFSAISSHGTETYFNDCGRQYSVLGGRGIIATALLMLVTATASKIIMDFNSILFNTMALLLSVNDFDSREDGIAVSEPGGLYFLNARLGE